VLPLAPVSNVALEQLEEVVTAVAERLKREAEPAAQKLLWTATTLFIGLRHRREQVESMIERVGDMILGMRGIEESWVYQDILTKGEAKGAVDEARNALLRLGRKKLGEPDERVLELEVADIVPPLSRGIDPGIVTCSLPSTGREGRFPKVATILEPL
jgi:hypothetical protein